MRRFGRIGLGLLGLISVVSAASLVGRSRPMVGSTSWLPLPGTMPLAIAFSADKNGVAYAALKQGGLGVFRIDARSEKLKLIAKIPIAQLGNQHVMSVEVQGKRAFVALGDFFDAGGAKAGVAILDISESEKPKVNSIWVNDSKTRGASSTLFDGQTLFLAAMHQGLFVFSVTEEHGLQFIRNVPLDLNFPKPNPTASQRPNTRGLAKRENHLFIAFDSGGLRVLDTSNLQEIREVGRYINSKMLHKQQAYNHVIIDQNLAYVATDYAGVEVLDVSDISNIRQVAWWNPWRAGLPTNIWLNSPGHTNQLILDSARKLLYVSAGDSELVILDVSDPARPKHVGGYGKRGDKLGTWGVNRHENSIYLTYITALFPFVGQQAGIRQIAIRH